MVTAGEEKEESNLLIPQTPALGTASPWNMGHRNFFLQRARSQGRSRLWTLLFVPHGAARALSALLAAAQHPRAAGTASPCNLWERSAGRGAQPGECWAGPLPLPSSIPTSTSKPRTCFEMRVQGQGTFISY